MNTLPPDVPSVNDSNSDAFVKTSALPDDIQAEMDRAFGYDQPYEPTDEDLEAMYEDFRRNEQADAELRGKYARWLADWQDSSVIQSITAVKDPTNYLEIERPDIWLEVATAEILKRLDACVAVVPARVESVA